MAERDTASEGVGDISEGTIVMRELNFDAALGEIAVVASVGESKCVCILWNVEFRDTKEDTRIDENVDVLECKTWGVVTAMECGTVFTGGLWQITSASFLWSQLFIPQPLCPQSDNDVSLPVHERSLNQTGPLPPWYSLQQLAVQAPI